MELLRRFSSRRQRLDQAFLNERLRGARSYRRIAGYFRSSIFELVGEAIEQIPVVQIVCNSELDERDILAAKHARETALKERWNEASPEVEALLHRARYKALYDLLRSGRVEIRVVPKNTVFLHGKAGVIELADGSKTCFLGSVNESKSAFADNYEIVWEDRSAEGVAWVEEEFAALWQQAYPLPDAIIEEIGRIANRQEARLEEVEWRQIPAAALAEAPIYRGGEQLQPWQRSFVTTFLEHRDRYGKARLLLADEVGLGKTLSLGASAVVASLLDDGPTLILCPANLTLQWQTELADKLGVPSCVWLSADKEWQDWQGHRIRTLGPEDIANCPTQIAIVSTGLIFQECAEREFLLRRRFGTVILDEAHRARRRGGLGNRASEPNNLLKFMLEISSRARHVLLGTATPIQTDVKELWDLMKILNNDGEFVLGRSPYSLWLDCAKSLELIKGRYVPSSEKEAWEWLKDPLPPATEHRLFYFLRSSQQIPDNKFYCAAGFSSLTYPEQQRLTEALAGGFFQQNNPIVRHTVLRRRRTLEERGLLERIGVDIHPSENAPAGAYGTVVFQGLGLVANHPFQVAYQAAEQFTDALAVRSHAAGFMKTLLLQRICSSFASGLATARKMRERQVLEDEEQPNVLNMALEQLTGQEASLLDTIIEQLSRADARDPKLSAVLYFLTEFRTENKTWLEHGCIIFSQYYDTVLSAARYLTEHLRGEPIAIYAGAGKSSMLLDGDLVSVEREDIKKAVREHRVRLVVATDAACEGLNLQTLGTTINIDMPWNPSRLEQRLGRIKRFGQRRQNVDLLNLVYSGTLDEKIYQVLSRRMKDRYDIFGSLPDTIDDDWIENVEKLEQMMDKYLHLRKAAQNAFQLRYENQIDPQAERWELCSKVLSRRDIVDRLSRSWRTL